MNDSIQNLIQAVQKADSPPQLIAAVQALVEVSSEAAIPTLIAVLGYNNPGAAAIAVEGLIRLGSTAVQPLLDLLDDYNYGARAYSLRALAAIADPRALEVLVSAAATDFAPSVRRAAAKGLGTLHWDQLPPEQSRQAQSEAYSTLTQIAQDSDWAIRYAAIVGLESLATTAAEWRSQIREKLEQAIASEKDLAVRARVQLAQKQLTTG